MTRAKNVGPRSKGPVVVKMTPEERAEVARRAARTGLPVSTFLRRLGLGYLPESVVDTETMLELIRLKADLGRLGGVLKMWLVDQPGRGAPEGDVRDILNQILDRQTEAGDVLAQLRTATGRKAPR